MPFLACCCAAEPAHECKSFWRIGGQWQADSGDSFTLQTLENGPSVVAMFYTGCHVICPTTVEAMQWLERNLSSATARNCHFVLVTLDPGGDTPEELRTFRTAEGLSRRWTLLRTNRRNTQIAADWLGVRFEVSSYHTSHSSALIVLDSSGRVVSRHTQLDADLRQIREELDGLVQAQTQP